MMNRLIALMLCWPLWAGADTWYVRPVSGEYGAEDGTSYEDAFDGFSDIAWGGANVAAGDTLYLCGEFDETALTVGADGSDGSEITISGACPDEDTVFSRTGGVTALAVGRPYIIIEDITFGAIQNGSDASQAIKINSGAHHVTIRNNDFTQVGTNEYRGINANHATDETVAIHDVTISGNTFAGLYDEAIRLDFPDPSQTCSGVEAAPYNLTIEDNAFSEVKQGVRVFIPTEECFTTADVRPYGLQIKNNTFDNIDFYPISPKWKAVSGYSNTVSGNVIRGGGKNTGAAPANGIQLGMCEGGSVVDNYISDIDSGTGGDGVGIIVDHALEDRTLQSDGVLVARNFIVDMNDNDEACGISTWSGDNTTVAANIIVNSTNGICVANSDATGNAFYNNTILNPIEDCAEYSVTAAASTFRNNICVGTGSGIKVEGLSNAPTESNNLITQSDNDVTLDASDLTAAPLFIGGSSPTTPEGFRLKPDSPAIRAGTCYLTTGCVHYDYEGKRARVPPDIGAFQRNDP